MKNRGLSLLLLVIIAAVSLYEAEGWLGDKPDANAEHLRQLRETLLADPDSISGHWLRTLNPLVKDVQGDLVWNSQQQQGVMRIRHLPPPEKDELYQLWLYDSLNAAVTPVSGIILHHGAGGEDQYMAIKVNTRVQEPYKFVLTLEKENAGGTALVLLMVQP